ncbi:hypothetical protein D3C84_855130 [compost metagenome]
MHRHQPRTCRIGDDASGQKRDADAGGHAGDDGFDRAEFQRLGSQDAELGHQRIQALAIGAAEAKHHGLEILDTGDIVQLQHRR